MPTIFYPSKIPVSKYAVATTLSVSQSEQYIYRPTCIVPTSYAVAVDLMQSSGRQRFRLCSECAFVIEIVASSSIGATHTDDTDSD